jgi:hypothetical protein
MVLRQKFGRCLIGQSIYHAYDTVQYNRATHTIRNCIAGEAKRGGDEKEGKIRKKEFSRALLRREKEILPQTNQVQCLFAFPFPFLSSSK